MADFDVLMTAASATPITIADLRERLRLALHDVSEDRWDDDVLDRHLVRAAREVSMVAPREMRDTLETTAGSRELDLSGLALRVEVNAVEWPVGQWPPSYVQFSVYQDTLTILGESEPSEVEDAFVYWGALHVVDVGQCTLPAAAEEVVITGAAGYAALDWASFAINRANVAGAAVTERYSEWGQAQLIRFGEQRQELREAARVKASSLFTPATISSRQIVSWQS